MKVAIFAAVAYAAAVNAAPLAHPTPVECEPVGKPTVTAVVTPTPEPNVPGGICTVLPAGLEGVMVTDVAYEVEGIYCKNHKQTMQIWCTASDDDCEDDKKKAANRYLYCCGESCDHVVGLPEERLCEVNGKNYTVGVAYENVKIDGKKVTMWCLDEDTFVTCKGDKCGSTPELTPPGIETCDVKPPKPEPPVVRPENCMDCYTCTSYGFKWTAGKCMTSCAVADAQCFSHPAQCDAIIPPVVRPEHCKDCETCTSNGFKWTAGKCLTSCQIMDVPCYSHPAQCDAVIPPVDPCNKPAEKMNCQECTKCGYSYNLNPIKPGCFAIANACGKMAGDNCVSNSEMCPLF